MFYTGTKADIGEPIGVKMLEKIKKRVNIPVVGIGGINAENAGLLGETGIDGISVISAILDPDDIENAARLLRRTWEA